MRAHPAGPLHADVLHTELPHAPPPDLNRLDPDVWPQNAARDDGAIQLGGVDVRDLVNAYGTPAFVVDEADFRARAASYRMAFAGADVFYASKALLCRSVARWVHEEGLGLDVCTGGELALALSAGVPAHRIALHGNNKSDSELIDALRAGIGRIVIDSFDEIDRLRKHAHDLGVRPTVLVRVTVGVEAHTHEFIATAREDQKFGFSLATGAAAEAVRRVLAETALELAGIHCHIGSQIFDTSAFEVSAQRMVGLLAAIRDEHGVELPELDLGGGLGIAYVTSDDPATPATFATGLRQIVATACETAGVALPRLAVEPGRAIAGPAGVTLYRVGTVKPVETTSGLVRTYVSVDGGMSDNIRSALYDAEYTCVIANRSSGAAPILARVVGKHCESGDIVVKDVWLPGDVAPGDLLAVAATGAYCRSMASNYNMVGRPPVIAVREGRARVLVRRETVEDLLALDMG